VLCVTSMSGRLAGTPGALGFWHSRLARLGAGVCCRMCCACVCVLSSHNDVQNMFPLDTTRDPSHDVSIFFSLYRISYSSYIYTPRCRSRFFAPQRAAPTLPTFSIFVVGYCSRYEWRLPRSAYPRSGDSKARARRVGRESYRGFVFFALYSIKQY